MAAGFDELAAPLTQYLAVERPSAPEPAAGYSDPSKWESRYEEQEGTFDWYAGYAELGSIFQEFCPPTRGADPSVVMLGCGNSALSGEMHAAGYRRLTNIDISASAVKKMEDQFASLEQEWLVMDATAMTFEDCSYDLQVDKGTLDAMMHGGSSGEGLASAMTAEVWRTLRPGGVFLLISHNGRRHEVLINALADKHGPSAHWELLELRKCRLSPQSMLINILRSKLKGRPLMEGFRDPETLREATMETKQELKQMQFIEAFRMFKAKKVQQRLAAGEAPADEPVKKEAMTVPEAQDEDDDEAPKDSRRQPFCWVYILRKPF